MKIGNQNANCAQPENVTNPTAIGSKDVYKGEAFRPGLSRLRRRSFRLTPAYQRRTIFDMNSLKLLGLLLIPVLFTATGFSQNQPQPSPEQRADASPGRSLGSDGYH
jgi:hypothetical protein